MSDDDGGRYFVRPLWKVAGYGRGILASNAARAAERAVQIWLTNDLMTQGVGETVCVEVAVESDNDTGIHGDALELVSCGAFNVLIETTTTGFASIVTRSLVTAASAALCPADSTRLEDLRNCARRAGVSDEIWEKWKTEAQGQIGRPGDVFLSDQISEWCKGGA